MITLPNWLVICSRHLTKPVSWSLVSSESLFSEFLVTSVLDSVDFESVRVAVDEVRFGEEVRDWIHHERDGQGCIDHDLLVWNFSARHEHQVLRHVMSHLRSGRRSAIFILDHTIVQLWWHSNNHVIVVWVEMSTLWNIKTEWWVVMVSSQQVVRIVDQTRVVRSCLGEIRRPDAEVGILGLMNSHVWWPHSVVDASLSKVPLLEEVSSILLMSWMNLWQVDHLFHEFSLSETLVDQQVILLMHGSMASLTCSLEHLEASSKSGRIVGLPGTLGWPVAMTVVHTNRVDLLFITFNTMWGTDIISEKPGFTLCMSTNSGIGGERRSDRVDQCTQSI